MPGVGKASVVGDAMNAKGWEARLTGWHADYEAAGLAVVAHAPPPVKVLGGGGPTRGSTFRAAWCRKGAVDFIGVALGRAVFFDAKLCTGDRWSLRGPGGLEPHQERQLRHARACNDIAFVALHAFGRAWVVPLATIEASPTKTWTAAQTAAAGIPMAPNGWIGYVSDITRASGAT